METKLSPEITLRPARPADAPAIARLVMLAMNYDCCQYFAGPDHTLEDFRQFLEGLIRRDDTQHSYRNALVAERMSLRPEGEVVGVIIGYDGADLHRLRQPFFEGCLESFGHDVTGIPDETQEGEYYIDSLAVASEARHQGIATALLRAVISRESGRQPVGLLVDEGNPTAEQLYRSLGFDYVGDNEWGGHPMKHLQARG